HPAGAPPHCRPGGRRRDPARRQGVELAQGPGEPLRKVANRRPPLRALLRAQRVAALASGAQQHQRAVLHRQRRQLLERRLHHPAASTASANTAGSSTPMRYAPANASAAAARRVVREAAASRRSSAPTRSYGAMKSPRSRTTPARAIASTKPIGTSAQPLQR